MARGGDSKKRPPASRGQDAAAAAPPGKRAAPRGVAVEDDDPIAPSVVVVTPGALAAACAPARAAFVAYERLVSGADPSHASLATLLQQAAGGELFWIGVGGRCLCARACSSLSLSLFFCLSTAHGQ
jgi:hypothetical protein